MKLEASQMKEEHLLVKKYLEDHSLIESNIVRLPLVEIEDEKILDSINKICQEMTNNLNISKSI